jgi:hypothetical protein
LSIIRCNRKEFVAVGAAIISISLLSAGAILSLQYSFLANAQSQKTNQSQSQSNKTKSAGTIAPPIGNVKQLSKALGNNTKIISNNTNIGNPNAAKAAQSQQKVTSSTPKNGLASNPTKGSGTASSSGGAAKSNMTKAAGGAAKSNMTKAAGGAAKSNMTKAAGGAAKSNMTKPAGISSGPGKV